jgi:hypothetical protein
MTKSDEVRTFVISNYVVPARKCQSTHVTVVAGDVAKALSLHDKMSLVCSALGTVKLEKECGLKLLRTSGPRQGATTTFTFAI